MARIQYQQSQGKGWSNIDPGYISLSRMREKQKEDEQGEEKRLREQKEKDAQAEADQLRINKAVEANLKEINIESQVSRTQEAALRVNKSIAEQNFEAETKRNNVKSTLETLVELAPSAWKAKQKMDDADWDATAKAATEYYSTYGLEEARKFRTDLLEDEAFFGGQRLELRADALQKDGSPPEQVMFVRHRNKAADYGLKKALAIDAGNNYKSTLQSALLKAGLSDPAEQEAFINDFNTRYLQGHGLYRTEDGKQISADFLGPVYEKMSNARSDILGRSRLNKAFKDSGEHTNKYIETAKIAIRSKSEDLTIAVDATNTAYERIKQTPKDIYGNLPTKDEARNTLLEVVVNSGEPAYAEKVLKEIPYNAGGQDTNMWDGNKVYISKLLDQKKKDNDIKKALKEKADLAQQTADINSFKTFLSTPVEEGGWDRNQETIDKKVDEWNKKGYDPVAIQEAVGLYKDSSAQGLRDGDADLQNILEKRKNLTLLNEDLKDPTLTPGIVTQELRQETAKRRALIDQANYVDNFQSRINKQLKNKLVYKQPNLPPKSVDSDTLEAAQNGAETFFNQCIIDGGDKGKCITELDTEIKKDDGLFQVINYGDDDSREAGSYFANFTFKAEEKKRLDNHTHFPLNTKEQIDLYVELADDKMVRTHKLVIHPNYLKATEERIENGLPFEYHDVAIQMSHDYPERYPTPMEYTREQAYLAKKAGYLDNDKTFNFQTLRRAWINKAKDPFVKSKLISAQTNEDLQKAMELTNNPSSARNPAFMSNSLRRILTDPENTTSENFPFGGKGLPSPLLINYEEYNLSW